jgi:hypothetical protein
METIFVCDLVSADKLSGFCEVWYKSVLERCSASVGFVEISSVIVIINLCVLPVFFFTDMGEIWYRKFLCNASEHMKIGVVKVKLYCRL